MAHNPADENLAIPIAHDCNYAVFVATDVEHRIGCSIVRTAEALSQIGKIDEARMLRYGVPVAQRLLSVRMFVPKVTQHLQRNVGIWGQSKDSFCKAKNWSACEYAMHAFAGLAAGAQAGKAGGRQRTNSDSRSGEQIARLSKEC